MRWVLILLAFLHISGITAILVDQNVLGVSSERSVPSDYVGNLLVLKTTTAFDQKEEQAQEPIPFEVIYEEDPTIEYGVESILQAGVEGVRTLTYKITFWLEDEIDRVLINTEIDHPISEKIAKGTKIVWRELQTGDVGKIKYWYKMRVFATKYDHTCLGCNYTTSIGAHLQKGVCAVDPTVIKYYTRFYVPGYGMCQALDTGGLIKGNRIDLAYDDASVAPWGAQYVDIYLLDNQPY